MKSTALALATTLTFLLLLLAQACTKDTGKIPSINCDTISYAKHIAPIIANNCSVSGCHVNPQPAGPNVLLDTYDLLKAKGEEGRLKARVIDGTPSYMPLGGQLSADQKSMISCWLSNGYKP